LEGLASGSPAYSEAEDESDNESASLAMEEHTPLPAKSEAQAGWYRKQVARVDLQALKETKVREVLWRDVLVGERSFNPLMVMALIRVFFYQVGGFLVYPSADEPGNYRMSVWSGEYVWTGCVAVWYVIS
jgi:hypothetical protein